MSSSWELPESSSPRVVRSTASTASVSRPARGGGWIAICAIAILLLSGASYGSYRIYVNRLDAKFEKHCRALREARQWRELNQVSRKWLEANPNAMLGVLFAAQSHEKLGQYEEAVEILLRAPRNQKLSAIAIAEAAEIQFSSLNQPLEGVKNFEEAIRLDPKEAESRERLIFFYAMTMQRKKMTDKIMEAIRLGLETREDYVYLVGSEWLIFSNGPQWNHLWRKSDSENEHFNVARALGVVANGYVTPPAEAQLLGESNPLLRSLGSGIDDDAPEDRKGREVHYEAILRAYLEKYPKNMELLSYFLNRATTAGDLEWTEQLLERLPPEAEADGRFWRYKASWQLMKSRRAKEPEAKRANLRDSENSLLKAIELNPFDATARHLLAGILRDQGDMARVDRLEAIYSEGIEIRKLVLEAPSAHVDAALFTRIKDYVALCGQSDIADSMAKRLQLEPAEDFFSKATSPP